VVPLRNEAEHIGEQLGALQAQTYSGDWELVVVDNGSSDSTLEIVRDWAERLPDLQIIEAGDPPGINRARNVGIQAARGDFLAFCDGDDIAYPNWLESLVEAAGEYEVVGGWSEMDLLNGSEQLAWCPWWSGRCLIFPYGFLPSICGGNLGVWTAVAREIGFDEDFRYGASDVEFAWRIQLAGGRIGPAPDATVHYRLRTTLRDVMRQSYYYGKGGALLYSKFRQHGMSRNSAVQEWKRLARRFPSAVRDRGRRGGWLRELALRVGRLVGSARRRVFYP
jgi:glycosyltransferase involved in cell wall biosynthesis